MGNSRFCIKKTCDWQEIQRSRPPEAGYYGPRGVVQKVPYPVLNADRELRLYLAFIQRDHSPVVSGSSGLGHLFKDWRRDLF